MRAKYKINDAQVNDMLMTIEVTMTVAQWRELMRTKTEAAHYQPFGRLQTAISTALGDLARATDKDYEWKY